MKRVVFVLYFILVLSTGYSPALNDLSKYRDQEIYYLLSSSPSVPTRVAAIRTLGIRRSEFAVPYLVQLCYEHNREIRTASIAALGRIQTPEALRTYYFFIWDRSKSVTVWDQIAAVNALGKYPYLNVQSLIDVLDLHPDFRVSLAAARSLQKRPELEAKYAVLSWQPFLSLFPR